MFNIMGLFAQFERESLSGRVSAGMANAKAKGQRLGRKLIPPIEMTA